MRFWHDWRRQRRSRANPDADADFDTDSKSNANRNADTNPFGNAIGHTTASYANGDADSFTNSKWKAKADTTAATDTKITSHSAVRVS